MTPPEAKRVDETTVPKAERRHVTILICDLVDSVGIQDRLGPEDSQSVFAPFNATINAVAARHKHPADIKIDRMQGDSLLVCFGYPQAHEDDAERAVRAGLEIAGEVARLRTDPPVELQVRVGIDSGIAVIPLSTDGLPSPDSEILGRPPNAAKRLQGEAAPSSVLISDSTRRLIGNLFELVPLGPLRLKGFADPISASRVVGARLVSNRFEAFHPAASLAPLEGREPELKLLQERWERTCAGAGQVVLLTGEPGIGKSRLVSALGDRIDEDTRHSLQLQCSSYHANSAFLPLIDTFQRALGFTPDLGPAERIDRIEALAAGRYNRPEADISLLATLLSVPTGERFEPPLMTPQRQKEEMIRAMLELVEAVARERPTLMVVEDAHWVDPSTLEALARLVRSVARIPMLLIITYRSGFDDSDLVHPAATKITVSRLGRVHRTSMVASVCRGQTLPPEIVAQIAERSDGVPLFIEELTKAVLESLADSAPKSEHRTAGVGVPLIPATLRDSLMARLDRLGPAKLVAQIGACIGRQFSRSLLSAVTPLSDEELDRSLMTLTSSGLAFVLDSPEGGIYTFKHALVQNVALDSLLRSDRRHFHMAIARTLESRYTASQPSDPAMLAYHYAEAGETEIAVQWWKAAGSRAAMRSENFEAIHHLEQAIRALGTLPPSPERAREELDLQTMLGPVLAAARGYADTQVKVTYGRANELCDLVDDAYRRFAVLRAQFNFALLRAEYGEARTLAAHVLELARKHDDPEFTLGGHLSVGLNALFTGKFAQAESHLETSMSYFDPDRQMKHVLQQGILLGVTAGSYRARALWMLGFPDRALARCHQALQLAQTPSISLSITQAMAMLALLHHARGEYQETRRWVHQTLKHAHDQGHVYWSALAGVLAGWLRARDGLVDAGVQDISRSIAMYQQTGARLGRSWFLLLLAEAYQWGERYDEALAALAGALRHVEETGEAYYAAEIHRCWGEVLLASSRQDMAAIAEARFLRSLEIARAQGARSWELRTSTSLAKLWQSQGKPMDGAALLHRVHASFTEGFGARDLQDASTLLAELSLL